MVIETKTKGMRAMKPKRNHERKEGSKCVRPKKNETEEHGIINIGE